MKGRVIGGIVLAVVVVIFVLGQVLGGDDASKEPPDGWRGASGDGLGAWAAVLRHEGVRLRVRDVDPSRLRLLPGTTYLFAESLLDGRAADRVVAELRRGGRVVATGRDARSLLKALGEPAPTRSGGAPDARPARRVAETAAVDRVERRGPYWRTRPDELRPLLLLDGPGGAGTVVAGDLQVGRGRLVLVPDRGILDNDGIVRADNAAFAASVTGRGRVIALRTRDAASVGGLPGRVVLVVLLLVLAAAAALVAKGRRLGPAVQPDADPTPGRSGYVDALAAALARTKDRGIAAHRLRSRSRALLARRVGLAPDAGPDEVRDAARRAGLSAQDADAVAGTPPRPGAGPPGAEELQAVGRALARLEGDTR
ncbi:DUF4350 domain-containing protein [Patulibacter sp. NPDC049589]|uniref:DUF4350 domain-containing protein n=1 Tax=Patulibacter sp. NPDC049589 TaxID=3154731 RepID=UPI00342C17AF